VKASCWLVADKAAEGTSLPHTPWSRGCRDCRAKSNITGMQPRSMLAVAWWCSHSLKMCDAGELTRSDVRLMYSGCSMMTAYLSVAAKSWTQAGLMGRLSAT